MKKLALLIILCCIVTGEVVAEDSNWNVESGNWSDGANWALSRVPLATDGYINIRYSDTSICTLNTDEGLFGSRLIMQSGQTLNIENGGRFGTKWSRVGRNTASYINLSGNGTFVLNNDDLYVGLEGGTCELKMYDTSTLMVEPATAGGDNLYIASDSGTGLLQLNGSGVTVSVDDLYFTFKNTGSTATLEYVMDAGGASTIQVAGKTHLSEAGDAHLLLSATTDLAEQDIVLIESTSVSGVFDTVNGVAAPEGAVVILGGNVYGLTYNYENDGDVALVFLQSAKFLATDPTPANGSTQFVSPTTLSWTNPDPNDGVSDITCTVYLGMAPADPNRTGMDSVTLAPNASSVEINATNFPTYGAQPIEDVNDFYWVVDCVDASLTDPSLGKAPQSWSFSTYYNQDPTVDAGPDQVVYGDGANYPTVNLAGIATDDGLPDPPGALTTTWTQIGGPAGATINSPNTTSTSVTVTASGIYEFELTADDGLGTVSDTCQVIVGIDSCEASILNGSYYNSKDFDHDCDVDIEDLAAFMAQWLTCTNTLEGCI